MISFGGGTTAMRPDRHWRKLSPPLCTGTITEIHNSEFMRLVASPIASPRPSPERRRATFFPAAPCMARSSYTGESSPSAFPTFACFPPLEQFPRPSPHLSKSGSRPWPNSTVKPEHLSVNKQVARSTLPVYEQIQGTTTIEQGEHYQSFCFLTQVFQSAGHSNRQGRKSRQEISWSGEREHERQKHR